MSLNQYKNTYRRLLVGPAFEVAAYRLNECACEGVAIRLSRPVLARFGYSCVVLVLLEPVVEAI